VRFILKGIYFLIVVNNKTAYKTTSIYIKNWMYSIDYLFITDGTYVNYQVIISVFWIKTIRGGDNYSNSTPQRDSLASLEFVPR
jgi:hypothetical protein